MCHFTFLLTHSLSFFDRLSLFLSTLSFLDCPFFFWFASLLWLVDRWTGSGNGFTTDASRFIFTFFFRPFFFCSARFYVIRHFGALSISLYLVPLFFCFVGCWLCVSLFIFFCFFFFIFLKKILGPFSRLGTIFRKAPGSYLIDRFICNTHNISSVDFRFSFWLSSQGPRMFYWVLPSFFLASRGYCPKWFWLLPSFFF